MNEVLKEALLRTCFAGFVFISLPYLFEIVYLKKKPTGRTAFWWLFDVFGFCGFLAVVVLFWWCLKK